jgi:hypothetical protein
MKDSIVFTFGRFNPPTTGHEKLIEKVAAVAKKESADFMVFPSHSQNPKKDPLSHKDKISFMKKMFPKYSRNIINNKKAKTAIDIATMLYGMGYKSCTMIVGGDRLTEFKTLLNKYNSVEGKHGFYDFKDGINVVSAGERDPDAEGVTGMSASKMRAAAAANDYDSFKNGLPKKFEKTTGKKLFDVLRKSMNISEELSQFLSPESFREFIADSMIEILEDVDDGDLFEFLMEKRTPQDSDVEDKKGSQPKKYYANDAKGKEMSKDTKNKRDAHFKKQADKPDDKKSSYKPAAGDKDAKTKPSKHTNKFKQMYGEDTLDEGQQMGLIGIKQVKAFEKVVDQLFKKFGIDFNFTRHFGDRMDDDRNNPNISMKELANFIKKVYARQGKSIKDVAGAEAVLKDIQTNINIPVAVTYDRKNDEFDVVMKTIMRKKNFKTPDKVIKYEGRDYKAEREKYHGTPEQMERNRARKRARYAMEKAGKAQLGDGKDVHHKDNNPLNNDPKNLSLVSQHYNRREPRMRKEYTEQEYLDSLNEIRVPRNQKLVNKIKNSGIVKTGSMSKDDEKSKKPFDRNAAFARLRSKNSKKESMSGAENQPFRSKAGGGEDGTGSLRDRYMKDTPHMSIAEKIMSPKELYWNNAVDSMSKIVKSKGDERSLKGYALTIAKSYGGMNYKELLQKYKDKYL